MAKTKKKTARQEEGLVESNFEQQPNDEVVAAGEHLTDETVYGDDVILSSPSALASPYMSAEDQMLELKTEVVGPPAYGSPEPATSAAKLLPLNDHPLRADLLPEGHPAAISEDYGAQHEGATVMPGESSSPITPGMSDYERDLLGGRDAREGNYEEMTKDELLNEAQNRGLEVSTSMKKAEIVDALEADDAENADAE